MVVKPPPPLPTVPKAVAAMIKKTISIAGSANQSIFSSNFDTRGMEAPVNTPTVPDVAGNKASLPRLPSPLEVPSGLTKKSLLPYAIRKVAAKELLYGGTRVLGLVQPPPALVYHRSDLLKIPSPDEEVAMENFVPEEFGARMLPNNVAFRSRSEMLLTRNKDLHRRFLAAHRDDANSKTAAVDGSYDRAKFVSNSRVFSVPSSIGASHSLAHGYEVGEVSPLDNTNLPAQSRRRYHPSRSELSVLPASNNIFRDRSAHFGRARNISSGVPMAATYASPFAEQEMAITGQKPTVYSITSFYDQERQRQLIAGGGSTDGSQVQYTGFVFKPFQLVMPVQGVFSYAMRAEGLRSPSGHLRQETLDRKGFGWRKKQRTMWQQDTATRGFKPDRFF